MSGLRSRSIPAPGQAPLIAPNAAALLRRNATEFGDAARDQVRRSTRGRIASTSRSRAGSRQLFDARLPREGAAARGRAPRQHPRLPLRARRGRADRRGSRRPQPHPPRRAPPARHRAHALRARDHRAPARGTARAHRGRASTACSCRPDSPTPTIRRRPSASPLEDALAAVPADDLGVEPDIDAIWALIFTSGTSSAPKAVICSQRRLLSPATACA